jgi:glucose-6-phosphate dehydrogenase assembly protein OpcA
MNAGVDVAQIERQLRELWEQAGPDVTRASLFNLVAWCESTASRDAAVETINRITGRLPCRAIVVLAEPQATSELSATVTAYCQLAGGGRQQVCCEQISITAGGNRVPQVVSATLPLLEADLPTVVWWRGNPAAASPIFASADRVLFDSAQGNQFPTTLPAKCADLNWTRLALWREMLADCFEDPLARAALPAMERLTIVHGCGPGAKLRAQLFAGWIRAQSPVRVEFHCRQDGEATAVGLLSVELSGPAATVKLWKNFGERTASAQVTMPHVCSLPSKRAFRSVDEAALLARELEQPSPPQGYRQALAGVAVLL